MKKLPTIVVVRLIIYTTASVLGFKEIAEQWLGEEVAVQHVDLDKELEND